MYIIPQCGEAVVLDPCNDLKAIRMLRRESIDKVHILLTHEHYDHVSGVACLKRNFKTDIYCQEITSKILSSAKGSDPRMVAFILAQQDKKYGGHRYEDFKAAYRHDIINADKTFDKEDAFNIGGLHFHVWSTPGHSKGSACYILNGSVLFSGDSLLQHGGAVIGFPDSDAGVYKKETLPFLRSLPKDMMVLPGHGDPFVLADTDTI